MTLALPQTSSRAGVAPVPTQRAATDAWFARSPEEVLKAQEVDPQQGLSTTEVQARTQKFGPNKFAEAKTESRWQAFTRQYRDPMQMVLLAAGIVCIFLPDQFWTGVLLLVLTLFNAWLGMNQEGKAEASAAALQ